MKGDSEEHLVNQVDLGDLLDERKKVERIRLAQILASEYAYLFGISHKVRTGSCCFS